MPSSNDDIITDLLARHIALEALMITFISGMAEGSEAPAGFLDALVSDTRDSLAGLADSDETGRAAIGRLALARLEQLAKRLRGAIADHAPHNLGKPQ